MAFDEYLCRLQVKIGHPFTTIELLEQALTAAGAEEENYDGNRKLAQMGEILLECVVVDKALTEGWSRSRSQRRNQSTLCLHLGGSANDTLKSAAARN
jgi:dsRNA-specific ribonuclease